MNISESVKYIGVDDTTIDLFESQYVVPEGVSYNSYVILDEKIAIMDTVDKRGMKEWEDNLLKTLDGKKADYVIVQHMCIYFISTLTIEIIGFTSRAT